MPDYFAFRHTGKLEYIGDHCDGFHAIDHFELNVREHNEPTADTDGEEFSPGDAWTPLYTRSGLVMLRDQINELLEQHPE